MEFSIQQEESNDNNRRRKGTISSLDSNQTEEEYLVPTICVEFLP